MHRRINITLPEETVRLIDRVAEKGNRSRVIDAAIRRYVEDVGRENLRKQVEAGAIARAERDMAITEGWFALDEEAWQHHA